jgi:hypothetical protein
MMLQGLLVPGASLHACTFNATIQNPIVKSIFFCLLNHFRGAQPIGWRAGSQ